MRLKILCFLTGAAAFSVSSIAANQPQLNFQLLPTAIEQTLNAMKAENDTVLTDIEKDDPNFIYDLPAKTARFMSVAFNSVILPPNDMNYIHRDQLKREDKEPDSEQTTSLGYLVGKTIKNVIIFTFENALKGSTDESKPQDYKYKYCETNPRLLAWPCDIKGNESYVNFLDNKTREYILVRRMLSHPKFVENVCPVASEFAGWYLNWGSLVNSTTQAQRSAAYKTLFEQFDTQLARLKGDGTWKVKFQERHAYDYLGEMNRNGPTLPLDWQIVQFLERRYFDGGPQWIDAVSACSKKPKPYLRLRTQNLLSTLTRAFRLWRNFARRAPATNQW